QYTAAVWMGNPDGEVPMRGLRGGPVQGASYPARIWRNFTAAATAALPPLDFAAPDLNALPRPSYINELGRRAVLRFPPRTTTPETIPTATPTPTFATPTTRPRRTPGRKPKTVTTVGSPPTSVLPLP